MTRLHLLTFLVACTCSVCLSGVASGQLRDSFEGPDRTWQLLNEADCGVRVLAHERRYRDSHSGQGCEHFQMLVGNGTFLPVVHPIGRAPLITEFAPKLFVKSDRANLQFMVRIVFPRNIDRGTGRPITTLLRGDMYTDVGQWQQLTVRNVARLVEQETRQLRTRFGSDVDSREVFADLVVLNAYSAPGPINVWIDDLEIDGYINLDNTTGPQVNRGPTSSDPATSPPAASVEGSLVMIRGRPQVVRAIAHHGEPFEWLQSLGINTIKLSSSPAPEELREARRLGLWLLAPPPYGDQPQAESYDSVIAWSLGNRLTDRDLIGTRDLAAEIRSFDSVHERPLIAGADSGLANYSRLAHLLLLEPPTLGTTSEMADSRAWLVSRTRLARPGMPFFATLPTQRSPRLAEQLLLLNGRAADEDADPEQLRLAAFHAIAAGARGFVFAGEKPLAIDTGPAALRTDAIRLLNLELRLLEPWIAGGQISDEVAAPDGSVFGSILSIDRSRLLILTQSGAAEQYVLGTPPRASLSIVVPGVGIADRAYSVSLAGVKQLKISHTSGGSRIAIDDAPHAAAIVITQDHLAMHHIHRTLDAIKEQAARLRLDVAARRLAHTSQIDRQLGSEQGHPLASSQDWFTQAAASIDLGQRLLNSKDYERAADATLKAERLIARIRRGHWEQTAGAFPSPSSSPCLAQFSTLPLHWTLSKRLRERPFGPNVQAAGDMESLDLMLSAGWQQQRTTESNFGAELSLSLSDPHSGRSALRLQTWATDPKRIPAALEKPPLVVSSSPVPVRQGQTVRIRGWVQVPRRLAASGDGLVIFDSLGGPDLADRVRLTQGWREFTLYRAVPQTGNLTITFALTGLGEASIDDLSVSLLDPDPIKPR